ncbi:hypothetical protein Hanom_Chr05g00467401 [Helianthus anomalus]
MTKTEDGCGVCCRRQPLFPWREESIDCDSCILEIRRRILDSLNLLPSGGYRRNRVWDENVCLTILMFAFPCLIIFGMKIKFNYLEIWFLL